MKYLVYIVVLLCLHSCYVSLKLKSYGLKSNMGIDFAFIAKIDSISEFDDGVPIKYTISESYIYKSPGTSPKKVYMFENSEDNLWINSSDTVHNLPDTFREDGWYITSNGGSFGRSPFVWLCKKSGNRIRRYREDGIGTMIFGKKN